MPASKNAARRWHARKESVLASLHHGLDSHKGSSKRKSRMSQVRCVWAVFLTFLLHFLSLAMSVLSVQQDVEFLKGSSKGNQSCMPQVYHCYMPRF